MALEQKVSERKDVHSTDTEIEHNNDFVAQMRQAFALQSDLLTD